MDWKIEYGAEDRDTEIQLHVHSVDHPDGTSWFWSAFDAVEEDSCVSVLPGFDTKDEAMQAAENWYTTKWLPKFNETGDRWRAMNDHDEPLPKDYRPNYPSHDELYGDQDPGEINDFPGVEIDPISGLPEHLFRNDSEDE